MKMKRFIRYIVLAGFLLASGFALCEAQSWGTLNVTYGKMPRMSKEKKVAIVTDFSTTTWDEHKSLKRFWAVEYQDLYEEGQIEQKYAEFLESLHNSLVWGYVTGYNALKVVEEEEADYKFVVTMVNFHDTRDVWRRFVKGYGDIDVVDCATGEIVCRLYINGVKGRDDMDEASAAVKCMKEIGNLLCSKKR